jgi:prevent-host-death family protein
MAQVWQIQEAKNKLSEVITRAASEGPQTITKRGLATAVVLSAQDYDNLVGRREGIVACFLNAPRGDGDLDITRDTAAIREIDLS